MPDFPKVEIYVPDDHKEMDTADGNWWDINPQAIKETRKLGSKSDFAEKLL